MKFLLWLLIGLVVAAWWKKASHAKALGKVASESRGSTAGEKMMPCAHCGVHVPASESVVNFAGKLFCSEEHRRLGARS